MADSSSSAQLSPLSPSVSSSPDTSIVPRLLDGKLLARHVSTIRNDDFFCCHSCGLPFKKEDKIMVDLYSYARPAQESISMATGTVNYGESKLLLVHAATDCLPQICKIATEDIISRISFPERPEANEEETIALVLSKARWAVAWISWHLQFMSAEDPIRLQLGTRRPEITDATCPSFILDLTMTHTEQSNIHTLPAPVAQFSTKFVASLLSRVYQWTLVYKGAYNPLTKLADGFETMKQQVQIDAFGHTIPSTGYSASSANHTQLRLLVRLSPTEEQLAIFFRCLKTGNEEDEATWLRLFKHCAKVQNRPGDIVIAEEDEPDRECAIFLRTLGNAFSRAEESIQALLTSIGFASVKMEVQPLSRIQLSSDGQNKRTNVKCLSNVYMPSSAKTPPTSQLYYCFKDKAATYEQPLYCYQGILKAPIPIVVSNTRAMEQEIKEAGLKKVEMHALCSLPVGVARKGD